MSTASMLEKEKKTKKTIEEQTCPSSAASFEQKTNEPVREALNLLIEAEEISVSGSRANLPTKKDKKLFPGILPPVPHPSKSSVMEGLFTEAGQLSAIRKTYGNAPEAGGRRADGQIPVPQGHSYEMDSSMAKATLADLSIYQRQLEAIGVNVPRLLKLKKTKVTEKESKQHLISYDQEFIEGFNFEDIFKLACDSEVLEIVSMLVESMLQYLKQIIDYKVSAKDKVFKAIPKEGELPFALDLKPNNFVIHFDELGKASLWFIDIFAPGNRDQEPSTPFIRRFLDQADGDIAWKYFYERLIKKSGIYSKLALELGSIVFTLNIPNSLKCFYLEEITNQIEKFIAENDPNLLADFQENRKIAFANYLEISGRAEKRRYKEIDGIQSYDPKEHITPPENGEWPEINLIVGPCRTGTTALQRALLPGGDPSFYQVLKHLRRNDDVGINANWQVPSANESRKIILKETLGPYTPSEIFNPIQDLLEAGCPRDKIKVLVVLRDPKITYKSWGKTFEMSPASEKIFFASWSYIKDLIGSLQVEGISYQTIFQEQLINNSESMLKNVCKFFDIEYTQSMLDWTEDHSSNSIIEPILEPEWYARRFQDPSGNGQANPINATQRAIGFKVPVYEEEKDEYPIFALIKEFFASLVNEEQIGEICND